MSNLNLNEITLAGHLGQDVTMRYTGTGRAVANTTMAVTKRWIDNKGEVQENTIWVKLTFWGKQAEAAATHLHKGSAVYVRGELADAWAWCDRQNNNRATNQVTVRFFKFIDSKGRDVEAADEESAEGFEVPEAYKN